MLLQSGRVATCEMAQSRKAGRLPALYKEEHHTARMETNNKACHKCGKSKIPENRSQQTKPRNKPRGAVATTLSL